MKKNLITLGVLTVLTLLGSSSCVKAPSTDVIYGEQATSDEVGTALADLLGPDTGHLALKDEFVAVETTQSYRGSSADALLQEDGILITKREKDCTQGTVGLEVVTSTVKHNQDGSKTPQVDRTTNGLYCLNGKTLSSNCTQDQVMVSGICKSPDADGNRITCHDLKILRGVIDPPAAVQTQPNCGGVPNCQLNVAEISFDRVTWDKPEGTKMNYRILVAQNVPYMAKELQFCQQLSVPVEDQRVLVTQCNTVVNFRYGTPDTVTCP
jgi:hypothetical protein